MIHRLDSPNLGGVTASEYYKNKRIFYCTQKKLAHHLLSFGFMAEKGGLFHLNGVYLVSMCCLVTLSCMA